MEIATIGLGGPTKQKDKEHMPENGLFFLVLIMTKNKYICDQNST